MEKTTKNAVLAQFGSWERKNIAKAGLNLSTAIVINPNRKSSFAKMYAEHSNGGTLEVFALAVVTNGTAFRYAARLRNGGFDVCNGFYCTKADFLRYKNMPDVTFVLLVSEPLKYEKRNYMPERVPSEAGWYSRDKSGYKLPNESDRRRAAHAYCARVRLERAKAAFNPEYREAAAMRAAKVMELFRTRIANLILETPDFWAVIRKAESYGGYLLNWAVRDIKHAQTAEQLSRAAKDFSKRAAELEEKLNEFEKIGVVAIAS